MSKILNFIQAQLILLCFLVGSVPALGQAQQTYKRGIEELQRGNISEALDLWYNSYEQSDNVDARIGLEFIRVVTEKQMRSFYEPATELYYRALTDGTGMESRVAIRQEIERLKPIIGEGIYRQWMNWWEEDDPALRSDMKGFWVQKDPIPAKPTNERLIEHWQRIATARERFNKNSNTVYGTDDRALIYIRYGEPDREKSGILTLQSFNIRRWLENQLLPKREQEGRQRRDLEVQETEMMDRLQNAIYEFHRYPEYEIWFYDQITEPQDGPIIFMFGTDVRNDEFSLQTSLEDFIPERAFYPDKDQEEESLDFTRAGITPALMLQLLYYEQLAQVDDFFSNRLTDLQSKILEQGIQAVQGMDLAFKTESQEMINQQTAQIPREESTFTGLIPKIPLTVHQYRFLDDSLRPIVLTYVESFPQEAFLIDFNRNGNTDLQQQEIEKETNVLKDFPYYQLNQNLQMYDHSWEITGNISDQPPLHISRPLPEQPSVSVFKQFHTKRTTQSVSVELMNYDPESKAVYQTPFPPSLRGWNKLQYRQPKPLISHRDSLEVADLVLGYNHPTQTTEPFSFKIANDQLIPFGETLLLHFEVYNLKRQVNGFTHFELTYRILPVDKNGNILTEQAEFILTLNYTNEETAVIEDLEIETAELTPGFYQLGVSIRDTESDQTKARKIRFEVTE